MSEQEARRSWIQLGLEQKTKPNPHQRDGWGSPGIPPRQQHLRFPRGRCPCIPKVLSRPAQLGFAPACSHHGATQPPALEKLAGCYFKESWLEFLTNCYSLLIRCRPFQLCEQKKCDGFFFFASFSFWKMKGFVGKGCSGYISQFAKIKKKEKNWS